MWDFHTHISGRTERNPHDLEFFHTPDGWCEPLVRETIQNSLDAISENSKKVRMRYRFINPPKVLNKYLEKLILHYKPCFKNFKESEIINKKMLLIEDFGTTGLDGAISRTNNKKFNSNFYKFWWAEGSSFKAGTKKGRWGLGKTVLHGASVLRAFWGYTYRKDEQEFLLGKAMLNNHVLKNTRYDYDGYFADWKKNDKHFDLKTPIPISQKDRINEFRDLFHIQRDKEVGFSILIPAIKEEITLDGIIKNSIDNYFYPIMNDDLEVEVIDVNKKAILLNKSSIMTLAKKYQARIGKSDSLEQLRFIQNVLEFNRDNMIHIESNTVQFNIKKSIIDGIKDRFADNELLGFRIHTFIKPMYKRKQKTFFDVFLQKDLQLNNPEQFYIRSGIKINDVNKLKSSVRGILLAEDNMISKFLGDAENPSHTNWLENTKDFKEKYQKAASSLRLVKNAMPTLFKMIDIPPEGRDVEHLSSIFPKKNKEKGKKDIGGRAEDGKPSNQNFIIKRLSDGVQIVLKNDKFELPKNISIQFAYDVVHGNPFDKWKLFDFNMKELSINGKGTVNKKYKLDNNIVKLSIDTHEFNLEVKGFDRKRDVVVGIIEK